MFECRNMERHGNVKRKAVSAVERINVQGRRILSAGNAPLEHELYIVPKSGAYRKRECGPSSLRKFYMRGDLPLILSHDSKGNHILWKEDFDKLDYNVLLPIFFEGLSETQHPYDFFARQGIHDLLTRGGSRVLPVIPRLIFPIKKALNTRDTRCICVTLKVLQHLVSCAPGLGEALIPYFRQILPILNTFRAKNLNSGDGIEYSQRKKENVGDLILETLECLERHGGLDAFINIKYIVPTYESCFFR